MRRLLIFHLAWKPDFNIHTVGMCQLAYASDMSEQYKRTQFRVNRVVVDVLLQFDFIVCISEGYF